LIFPYLEKIRNANPAIPIIGKAMLDNENLSPKFPNTISISGAPILVPKIIPIAFSNQIIPAPTKETAIKETTALLCKIDVAKKPVEIDEIRFFVAVLKRFFKFLVTKKLIASSKAIVPNKNIQSHPTNNQICSRVIE